MQKIVPNLWFDSQAEEAANYYVSLFKNSSIGVISHYGDSGARVSGRPKGSVLTVAFKLAGQDFLALNGGPHFKFSEAISMVLNCDTQAEVDEYWEKLSQGGSKGQCGWLKDKYGLSWQIVPAILGDLMRDDEKAESVMKALLQMKKLDIQQLKQAAEQK